MIVVSFLLTSPLLFPYILRKKASFLILPGSKLYFGGAKESFGYLKENESFKVPESGFDIYVEDDLNSFLSFVNGSSPNNEGIIEYQVTNSNSEKLTGTFNLGYLKPFETRYIEFGKYIQNLLNVLLKKIFLQ